MARSMRAIFIPKPPTAAELLHLSSERGVDRSLGRQLSVHAITLFRFDARLLDDLRPLRDLDLDMIRELRGRASQRSDTLIGEAALDGILL